MYPSFDLCAPLDPSFEFDVVICKQVLEHVDDPRAAAANLRDLCRPGGHVVVSTPFLIPVHELEQFGMRDYWRFTPRGLATLLEEAGLVVDAVDGWGNRWCVLGNLGHWARARRGLPLHNDPLTPVQVWAFARRP
jgi:SAM-dependent methyltransferase